MTIGGHVKTPNLSYKSLDELQQSAELPVQTQRSFLDRKMTLERALKSLENLYEMAGKERQKNGIEKAYSYHFRIGSICRLIIKEHPVFSKTDLRSSPDGRRLHEFFKRSLAELEKMNAEFTGLYKGKTSPKAPAAAIIEVPALVMNGKPKDPTVKSSNVISPRELVTKVQSEAKSALIVDFREDRSEIIKFKTETQIAVAEIPRSFYSQNANTYQLIMGTIPVGSAARSLLNRLSDFDLVVLLDSGNQADPVDENGTFIRNSPTGVLSMALHYYNNCNVPKAPPLYLKGGFANWRMSYPVYVASSDGSAPKAAQFGAGESDIEKAIAKLRSAKRFDSYPDLLKPKTPPPPRAPVVPPAMPETSIPQAPTRYTPSEDGAFTIPDNVPYIESGAPRVEPSAIIRPSTSLPVQPTPIERPARPPPPTTAPSVPEPPARQVPQVDRSRKPKPLDYGSDQNYSLSDDSGNEKDVRTLGGGRPDVAPTPRVSAYTPSVQVAPTVPPSRPVIDRTTKEAIAKKDAEFQSNIMSVYEACVQNLRNKSRRGQVPPGCTGLVNIINTCFMNSTLQALANTASLRILFCKKNLVRIVNRYNVMRSEGIISAAFAALLDTMWSGEFIAIQPEAFRAVFASAVNEFLANGQQHDAAEFETVLVDALHEDTNLVSHRKHITFPDFTGEDLHADARKYDEISKQFADSPVNHIFNLQTVSPKRCSSCRSQSVVFEGMLSISLDLRSDGMEATLEECLERYFSSEEVDVECSHCKLRQRMVRHTKMWRLPKVLVIQLKRFAEMGNNFIKKDVNVHFGRQLDVKPFLHAKADSSKSVYSLYSVTNHVGTLNSGHYYAYVKNAKTQQWLECNDESVKPMSEDSIQTKAAFVLYYTNDRYGSNL